MGGRGWGWGAPHTTKPSSSSENNKNIIFHLLERYEIKIVFQTFASSSLYTIQPARYDNYTQPLQLDICTTYPELDMVLTAARHDI